MHQDYFKPEIICYSNSATPMVMLFMREVTYVDGLFKIYFNWQEVENNSLVFDFKNNMTPSSVAEGDFKTPLVVFSAFDGLSGGNNIIESIILFKGELKLNLFLYKHMILTTINIEFSLFHPYRRHM